MTKRAIGVLSACFLIVFVHYAIRYSYGTLLPEMLPSLCISKAQAGIIYSCYFITYTVLSPVLGFLSDRYNVRTLLTVFVFLMGAGAFLMAYPASQTQAGLFFAIAGVGCSACWAPVMAVAQRWTGERRRGMSLAFVDAGSSLGVISAGAMTPLFVAAHNWRAAWMTLGILGFLLAILTFLLVRSHPERPSGPIPKTDRRPDMAVTTYRQLLPSKRFWLIGVAYLFTGFAIVVPFTFISTYAVQELSMPYASATRLVTIIGLGGIAGKLIFGPISDKLGRIQILIISAVFIGGGNLGIAYSGGYMLLAVTFLFGLGYGACWAMYAACASDFFSKQAAGTIIGLWTVYLGIGMMASPVIAGWIADATGSLMWSFLLATLGGIISLLLLVPMLNVSPIRLEKTH